MGIHACTCTLYIVLHNANCMYVRMGISACITWTLLSLQGLKGEKGWIGPIVSLTKKTQKNKTENVCVIFVLSCYTYVYRVLKEWWG